MLVKMSSYSGGWAEKKETGALVGKDQHLCKLVTSEADKIGDSVIWKNKLWR